MESLYKADRLRREFPPRMKNLLATAGRGNWTLDLLAWSFITDLLLFIITIIIIIIIISLEVYFFVYLLDAQMRERENQRTKLK